MSKVILFSGEAEHGKTASAKLLQKELESKSYKCLILSFANYLKFICKTYYGWDGNKDEKGRHILQHVGTDIVRKRKPTFWVQTIIDFIKVFQNDYDYFIIDDCRFPDEITLFKDNDLFAFPIRVLRLNFENKLTPEQRLHASEKALDNYNFDYILTSESGLENLSIEINKLFNKYVGIYW